MRTNKLKLNDGKTEVVIFGTRQQLEKFENNENVNIKIGDEVIRPAPSARNLLDTLYSLNSSQKCTLENLW